MKSDTGAEAGAGIVTPLQLTGFVVSLNAPLISPTIHKTKSCACLVCWWDTLHRGGRKGMPWVAWTLPRRPEATWVTDHATLALPLLSFLHMGPKGEGEERSGGMARFRPLSFCTRCTSSSTPNFFLNVWRPPNVNKLSLFSLRTNKCTTYYAINWGRASACIV